MLTEILVSNLAHQRVMTHLEIERIARETGEPFEQVHARVQELADKATEQVKAEFLSRYADHL